MDYITLKDYFLTKSGAFEDYPFGPEPVTFKVQSKMFGLLANKDGKVFISLKCDPFVAQNLREQYASVTPGYHLNKEHWNTVHMDGTISDSEIFWMIDHSYELVIKNLKRDEKSKLNKVFE